MARRKPASGKQRKAKLQLKRAVQRGDAPAPESSTKTRQKTVRRGPTGLLRSSSGSAVSTAVESSRKLQSAFQKLDARFLEDTKSLASTITLARPISYDACIIAHDDQAKLAEVSEHSLNDILTVPKRPKWRFDMTKKEVERNEEGLFIKWISETDAILERWRVSRLPKQAASNDSHLSEDGQSDPEDVQDAQLPELHMPPSPAYFERNLEVWRQLWRVTEISHIILLLLDARCPSLHFPPSLAAYLSARNCKLILVLTKVDIVGHTRADAWTSYMQERHPGVPIVQVESYAEKPSTGEGSKQGRKIFEPHIPLTFRERLVNALRQVHASMLQPPERIQADEGKLRNWRPVVKREVDWEAVLHASGGQTGKVVGGATVPLHGGIGKEPETDGNANEDEESTREGTKEPEYLTIGVIGQPNVGKSSLLNALFGTHKVRASRTPGKTKHFQTLFWTHDVRLVDCPGIVMPALVPMEIQVLSGILPISRVSAIPFCVHYIAQLLPLERIFRLSHSALRASPVEDKRTWRGGVRPSATATQNKGFQWTTMDILTAYADAKGWVTAKAGRPDVNRAGNAVLRAVAEGRIRWAFWPPGTDPNKIEAFTEEEGDGIWIRSDVAEESDEAHSEDEEVIDETSDDGDDQVTESGGEDDSSEEEEEEEGPRSGMRVGGVGRFDALTLDDSVG